VLTGGDLLIMETLLEGFIRSVRTGSDNVALVEGASGKSITYGELDRYAAAVAGLLAEKGVRPHDRIAVSFNRGTTLIAGVLGVLYAGAAYVPVDPSQPLSRRAAIYEKAGIKYCLTFRGSLASEYSDCCNIIVDELQDLSPAELPEAYSAAAEDTAYIIFTSGSTGVPKGVEIQHGAAMNTITDIHERYGITAEDRAIAVSSIDFDLSVFDVFGLLSVGGSIVLLDEANKKEPQEWIRYIKRYSVTIWNSVPALFEMLMYSLEEDEQLESLRLVLLSGDWVKKTVFTELKKHCKNAGLVALGGATEASIWSNYFEVKEIRDEWNAIPYGYPLTNQKFRVVKDEKDASVNEIGELWIGGKGLAKGYVGEEKLTADSFVYDSGERWYRTGDLGYFNDEGIMIFAGRMDQQVKVNGMRIELGEVESKLASCEGIKTASAMVKRNDDAAVLVAVLEPEQLQPSDAFRAEFVSSDTGTVSDNEQAEAAVKRFVADIIAGLNDEEMITADLSEAFDLWKKWSISNPPDDCSGGRWDEILSSRKELYKKILTGEEMPQVLLEDDELSPSGLFINSEEGKALVQKLTEQLRTCITSKKDCGRKLNIAFLNGKQGDIYISALKNITDLKDQVNITYYESSDGLLTDAKERFSDIDADIKYKKLIYPYADTVLAETADIVVILNGLHAFTDVDKGLRFVQIIMKTDGCMLALENENIGAMGIITAGILENGFSAYDEKRKKVSSPMLTAEEWCSALKRTGFSTVSGVEFTGNGYFVFKAEGKTSPNASHDAIDSHCRANLLEYMIPHQMLYTVDWQLSANGKVDRKKILEQFELESRAVGTEPESETEKGLAEIWSELLGGRKVYRENSFLEIGGDSLTISRMIADIRNKYGIQLGMKDVFSKPTLVRIASLVDEQLAETEFEEGEL